MGAYVLGVGAALASASCYGVGVTLQALEARTVPESESLRLSLLRRLLRRPRWIGGTAAVVAGWALQALALALAPLTIVQPTLALGLIVLLIAGVRLAGEEVGTREVASVAVIVAGVLGLGLAAPKDSGGALGDPVALVATLGAFGAIVLAPYGLREGARRLPWLVIFSAGLAYACSGFSTKFVADALSNGEWPTMLLWLGITLGAATLGLLSEMTALQARSAIRVFPTVLVTQMVVAVVLAPLLAGEGWSTKPFVVVALAASLAVVAVGTAVLASAPPVVAAVETTTAPEAEPTPAPSSPRPRAAPPAPAARALTSSETAGRSPSGRSAPASPRAPGPSADPG